MRPFHRRLVSGLWRHQILGIGGFSGSTVSSILSTSVPEAAAGVNWRSAEQKMGYRPYCILVGYRPQRIRQHIPQKNRIHLSAVGVGRG